MKDLTKGRPVSIILRFMLPIFFGNIFQLFYNMGDTWIIGRFLGDEALAAVGSVSPISDLIVGFLMGLTNGFAVLTARAYGAKDEKAMNKNFGNSIVFGVTTAIVLTILSNLFLINILHMIHVPQEHLAMGDIYIRTILTGMIASMSYNILASTLRAVGDTIAPLCFLIGSTILNLFLDFLMVSIFNQGIRGAALATIISQIVSAVCCFIYIYKRYPVFHLRRDSFGLDLDRSVEMWSAGLSMGLMNSLVTLGTLVLQGAINLFNSNIIVAHYAARKVTMMFLMFGGCLGMTMTSYCSQNYGAKKYERIKQGTRSAFLIGLVWYAFAIFMIYTCAPVMIRFLTSSNEPEIIQTATRYLRIDGLLYFVTFYISISRNSLQGIGDHKTPLVSSGIELIGKILVASFLAPAIGYMGIILCEPIVWVVMILPLIYKLWTNPAYKNTIVNE